MSTRVLSVSIPVADQDTWAEETHPDARQSLLPLGLNCGSGVVTRGRRFGSGRAWWFR